jgi:hypothetical protein
VVFQQVGKLRPKQRRLELAKLPGGVRKEILKFIQPQKEEEEESEKKAKKPTPAENFASFYAEIRSMATLALHQHGNVKTAIPLYPIREVKEADVVTSLEHAKALASELDAHDVGLGQLVMMQSIRQGRVWEQLFQYWQSLDGSDELDKLNVRNWEEFLTLVLPARGARSSRHIFSLRKLYKLYELYPNISLLNCTLDEFVTNMTAFEKQLTGNEAEARFWRGDRQGRLEFKRQRNFFVTGANQPFWGVTEEKEDEDPETLREKRAKLKLDEGGPMSESE